jgi:hypothetical protein
VCTENLIRIDLMRESLNDKMKPIVLFKRGRNPSTMPPRLSDLWRSHQNIRTFVEPANAAAFQ